MITDNTGGLPRYCHPYHGDWDVATIALDIPESRILFVCPVSCARNICLNAYKGNYKDRIDVLALNEDDIVSGNYEEKTLAAACHVLDTVTPRPKALILYVSCIDAMLGNDHTYQTKEIMARYPDVNCFVLKMCPITRFSGDLPLTELQHDMYAALPAARVPKQKLAAFIGTNIAPDPQCELVQILEDNGYRALHIQACDSYEDYLAVRSSSLNLCMMPFGKSAGELLQERYGTPFIPYLLKYDFTSIRSVITGMCSALDIPVPDLDTMEEETRQILRQCADRIHGTELVIDSSATLFPDALRNTLASCGFRVRRVYADDIQRRDPDADSGSILMPGTRSYAADEDVIAIGMVSSSFEGACATVNQFYDNGEWGHYGLRRLAERILDAYHSRKSSAQVRKEARK
ncbi:MAG: nitrogenase component 1 [Solobacterium sp.]|nr:nitrogenase component 1 [Solobacterium sp.]